MTARVAAVALLKGDSQLTGSAWEWRRRDEEGSTRRLETVVTEWERGWPVSVRIVCGAADASSCAAYFECKE